MPDLTSSFVRRVCAGAGGKMRASRRQQGFADRGQQWHGAAHLPCRRSLRHVARASFSRRQARRRGG
eukprot:scaffold29287_cov59-Phaeocystis_antarctica.AAC.1